MIILLLLIQVVIGTAILIKFRVAFNTFFFFSLSALLGVAVFSIIPFLLQLMYVPITAFTIFGSISLLVLLALFIILRSQRGMKGSMVASKLSFQLYELPFLLIILYLVAISAWRCFYLPPTPFDAISGGELVAEYAIREKTMINSAFSVESSGNTLKPPFLTSLQVIYKMAGIPFGQVWLINIVICFLVILYQQLIQALHKIIAGFLLVAFVAIPEMYGYTYMALYDYSNAVFFFVSIFFFVQFFIWEHRSYFWLSALLMAIATYIRPEMPALILMILPLIFFHQINNKHPLLKSIITALVFAIPSMLTYLISVTLYINFYLPQEYSVSEQINPDLWSFFAAFNSITKANSALIFSKNGVEYYSYFIYFFLVLLALEFIFKKKITRNARSYLYAIAVVYLAYPLLNHLLPGLTIENSVKRGYFKMFPLMVMYCCNNALLIDLSTKIKRWESNSI